MRMRRTWVHAYKQISSELAVTSELAPDQSIDPDHAVNQHSNFDSNPGSNPYSNSNSNSNSNLSYDSVPPVSASQLARRNSFDKKHAKFLSIEDKMGGINEATSTTSATTAHGSFRTDRADRQASDVLNAHKSNATEGGSAAMSALALEIQASPAFKNVVANFWNVKGLHEHAPQDDAPGDDAPGDDAPGDSTTGHSTTGNSTTDSTPSSTLTYVVCDDYSLLVRKLNLLMVPPPHSPEEMAACCTEDWERDSSRDPCTRGGVTCLTFGSYHDAWFELADFWVDIVVSSRYVDFVTMCFEGITKWSEEDGEDHLRVFKVRRRARKRQARKRRARKRRARKWRAASEKRRAASEKRAARASDEKRAALASCIPPPSLFPLASRIPPPHTRFARRMTPTSSTTARSSGTTRSGCLTTFTRATRKASALSRTCPASSRASSTSGKSLLARTRAARSSSCTFTSIGRGR